MLHKTIEIEEIDLVDIAAERIESIIRPNDTTCYIPYIDDTMGEIKYIKFELRNMQWIYVDMVRL